MFDFGFTELLLCAIIALVVLGPEKLPAVARAIGRWTGQAKGYVRNLNAELDRELKLRELREQVNAASKAAQEQVSAFSDAGKKSLNDIAAQAEKPAQAEMMPLSESKKDD